MYYLTEFESLSESCQAKEKEIILFTLELSSKKKAKEQLALIQGIIDQRKFPKTALQVTIIKIENYIPGLLAQVSSQFDFLIGYGGHNKVNRFLVEQCRIDFLRDPHNTEAKQRIDFIHHFNSGLNQVLVSIMKQKGIGLLISVTSLHSSTKALGRVTQNIKLCRKKKIPTLLVSTKSRVSAHSLAHLGSLITLTRQEIKKGYSFLGRIIDSSKHF